MTATRPPSATSPRRSARAVLWVGAIAVLSAGAALASSCGARTDLEPIRDLEGAGGASSSTGSPSSTTTSTDEVSSTAASSSSGIEPSCTALGSPVSEPAALTEPNGDAALTSLLAEGDRTYFASINNNDPSPDPVWRVRQVAADVSRFGDSQVVAKHPQSVSFSGMSLASANGHRGGLFWDESHGCRFVSIQEDGSPGESTEIDPTAWCYGLVATSSGFQAFLAKAFSFEPLTLLTLDANGKLLTSIEVLEVADAASFPRGRAVLDDGSYLLAFSKDTDYFAARVSPDGEVITPPHSMVSLGAHERFAITSAGAHALAVWSSDHAPGDVLVARLDASGKPEAVTLVGHATPPVLDVTIREYGGGALVAWSDASDDSIHVARVDVEGNLVAGTIEILAPGAPHDLRVVPTNFGAMVGFAALAPGALTQVWATALPCVAVD